jgi:outer membrane protein OmpA-like peptidoglycan-associated protein
VSNSLPTLRRLAVAALAAATLSSCATYDGLSERQKGTAAGAGIGAVTGAVIGSATGGRAGTGALIGGALGAVAGNLWSKRMEDKRAAMEQATAGTGIEVQRTADNQLKVNVPSDLSFDVNSATLKPELRPVLDQFAQGLDTTMLVRIIGHTDSSGSDAINNPLSLQRAQTVRDFLSTHGVPAQRMAIEGRGSREPVAENSSEAGRARNRRVEILLSEPQA